MEFKIAIGTYIWDILGDNQGSVFAQDAAPILQAPIAQTVPLRFGRIQYFLDQKFFLFLADEVWNVENGWTGLNNIFGKQNLEFVLKIFAMAQFDLLVRHS